LPRPRAPTQSFRGDSQLSTWLYGIAMNLVRNHLSRSPQRLYASGRTKSALDDTAAADTPDPRAAMRDEAPAGGACWSVSWPA
jgi:DNA-directed RNA polymerase specialized sigma24 family protein